MLETAAVIALCVAIARVAESDGLSGFSWGLITFLFCGVSLLIPMPFLRVLLAGALVFGLMMVVKMRQLK